VLLAEERGRALARGQVLRPVGPLARQLPQQRVAGHMRRRHAAARRRRTLLRARGHFHPRSRDKTCATLPQQAVLAPV